MKFVFSALLCLLSLSPAFVYGEENPGTPSQAEGTEVVAPVSADATQGLFERVRGAYTRAARQGRLIATAPGSATQSPVKQ